MRKLFLAGAGMLLFVLLLLILAVAIIAFFYNENEKNKATIEYQERRLNETMNLLAESRQNAVALNSSLKKTSAELVETQERLRATEEELNETRAELLEAREKLNKTEYELNIMKITLNKTKAEINDIKKEIEDLQKTIEESTEWFKENSFLPSSIESFTYRVQSRCTNNERLNLACVSYLMSTRLHLHYIDERPDRLFSLNETIARGGGDCEDFALFLKATINTLKQLENKTIVEGWEEGEGTYTVYVEKTSTSTTEYYVNGHGVSLGRLGDLQPYVVCYVVDSHSGHCIVALSEKIIRSVDELEALNGSKLFEPQNGMYVGEIGKDLVMCSKGEKYCERKPNSITFVISDDDLYQFSDQKWRSYSLYSQRLADAYENMKAIEPH